MSKSPDLTELTPQLFTLYPKQAQLEADLFQIGDVSWYVIHPNNEEPTVARWDGTEWQVTSGKVAYNMETVLFTRKGDPTETINLNATNPTA